MSRVETRVMQAAGGWSGIGQIATRVGIPRKQARDVVRLLVAQGGMTQMRSSPIARHPRPRFRRVAV